MEVSTRWRLAALALFGTLLAWHSYDVATPGLTDRSGRLKAPDFLQFYTYGALVAGDQAADLYDADAHAAIARRLVDPRLTLSAFVPNYSPVIAWLAAPLARLPFPTAMAVFALVSAALYGAAVATLASVTARIKTDVKTAVLVAAAFPAVFITIRYGQISPLSLLILAAATAAAARGRPWLAGASLGLLVYKPNLLLAPGLLLLAAGQWRLLMGLMVGAGAELALNLALVGPDVMRQYLALLVTLAKHPELVQFYPAESHSLRGLVQLLLPWSSLVTASTAIAIPLATWLAVRVWRTHADFKPRWAALVIASLLASPHVLTYDLTLLAVPLVLLLDWWLESGTGPPSVASRWGLALLYFGAWPGPLIARLYHIQPATLGMFMVLWGLAFFPASSVDTPAARLPRL